MADEAIQEKWNTSWTYQRVIDRFAIKGDEWELRLGAYWNYRQQTQFQEYDAGTPLGTQRYYSNDFGASITFTSTADFLGAKNLFGRSDDCSYSKSPSVWSRSASVSRIASIGVPRVLGRGCQLKSISCERRSGDAFTNIHRSPSALMATLHWVRVSRSPARAPTHWRHARFHCGTPPPAADPNNCITIA